ncbi:phenylpyruvate tautomerase [Pelomyxa schiedti]|nr:phenylpyruvate tautomerase [Pelomyxa schiedti]
MRKKKSPFAVASHLIKTKTTEHLVSDAACTHPIGQLYWRDAAENAIGKPIVYCMATVNEVVGCFAGQPGPCAFVMIKSIGGLNGRVNNVLCAKFCEMLATKFGIAGERIYLNFQDVPASSWGHDGATFG